MNHVASVACSSTTGMSAVSRGASPCSAASATIFSTPICRLSNAAKTWRTANANATGNRSEEHTSELQSLMRISYAVFCLKKKKTHTTITITTNQTHQHTYTQ